MKEDINKYKDYPLGSVGRKIYDSHVLPFDEFLKEYYSSPKLDTWELWQKRYIEPAFDENRHLEMIKNFGYVSIEMYDFEAQNSMYSEVIKDERLTEDVKRFIGFLAGTKFFKRNDLSLNKWFEMKNWQNPYIENDSSKSINEILQFSFGINLFKENLPLMTHWRR